MSNWWDKTVEFVAPRAGLKRAQARVALDAVRKYEAAAKGRRTDGWGVRNGTSANTEIRPALTTLRARSRDLVRNNAYAEAGVSFIARSMIGYGITASIEGRGKRGTQALRDAWSRWAETTECDADGRHNLYGLQELVARAVAESGEALVRRRYRRSDDGLAVPLQMQVLEADFLDHGKDGADKDGNPIVQGVQFDKLGRRMGYWLYQQHPGEATGMRMLESKFVPAEDIIHIYRMDRPGQVRGVPWLAPVMLRLRDFDEYADAQLVRQKIAACFVLNIQDMAGTESADANDPLPDKVEPGLIMRSPNGTEMNFATPPAVQGYHEYGSFTLHEVAAGLGIPYEAMTGDYSGVNFTSGRMGQIKFHRNLDAWQWNMFIPQFCAGIGRWFLDAGLLAGLPVDGARHRWTPPRRELTDNTREIPSIIKAWRAGLEPPQEALRAMGYSDPVAVLDQYAEWNKELDSRGITLDTDPRKMSGSGNPVMDSANPANPSNNGEETPPAQE